MSGEYLMFLFQKCYTKLIKARQLLMFLSQFVECLQATFGVDSSIHVFIMSLAKLRRQGGHVVNADGKADQA